MYEPTGQCDLEEALAEAWWVVPDDHPIWWSQPNPYFAMPPWGSPLRVVEDPPPPTCAPHGLRIVGGS